MTSLVNMGSTLFAPSTIPSYCSESESAHSEENFAAVKLKRENDPILGYNMEHWNNDLMRLQDELSKYGVTDIFMENKKSSGTIFFLLFSHFYFLIFRPFFLFF